MLHPRISVCMIVKNEEINLAACLRSVLPIAFEIIIVDTGSTDRTIGIAEHFGAKVLKTKWKNDFSHARNISLQAASGEWIVQVDADEQLENPNELLNTLHNVPASVGGFFIDVFSKARRADGGSDDYTTQLPRIFRNHPLIRFKGAIHEQITDSIFAAGFEMRLSHIRLMHHGYDISPDNIRRKNERNLALLDAELSKNPGDVYLLLNRAKTYLALGSLVEAEKNITAGLLTASGNIRSQLLNIGAIVAFQSGNAALTVTRAQESLSLLPQQAFAQFILGEACWFLKDYHASLQAFLKMELALQMPDASAMIAGEYRLPPEQIAFKIGRCYIALQDWTQAEIAFKKGLKFSPDNADCLIGMANIAARTGGITQAKVLLLKAHDNSPQRADIKQFLRDIDQFQNSHHENLSHQNVKEPSFKKPLISLSMIVKNEEQHLSGCLESVRGIADEIIIVDTGSTDRTIEIAKSFGAKIYHFSWIGDFAAARNESLMRCTGEWVLYLDADERLDIAQPERFKELLKTVPAEVGGFVCTIVSPHRQLNDSTEVHEGGYPRLFKNYGYPRVHFKGRVHEQITPSLLECGAKIVNSDVKILHLGYDQSQEVMQEKVRRNYTLLIRHVEEEPQNAYAWFQLGQTLSRMQLFKEAISALELSVNLGTLSPSIAASAASSLSQLYGNSGRYDQALQWAEYSLHKAPNQNLALNFKAHALLFLQRGAESEAAFTELLSRIRDTSGTSGAGFEVAISEKVVLQGLHKAKIMQKKL